MPRSYKRSRTSHRAVPMKRIRKCKSAARPRAAKAVGKREREPIKDTYGAIPGSEGTTPRKVKKYIGDVRASGSASVHLGDVHQVFVINVACCQQTPKTIATMRRTTHPYGILETGRHFRPDAYTHDSQEMILFNYSGDRLATDDTSQTYLLKLLYRSDAHNVLQIVLSLQVDVKSKYWHKLRPDSPARNTNSGTPAELLAIVEKWLRRNKSGKQDMYLRGTLNNSLELEYLNGPHDRAVLLEAALRARLTEMSSKLKHWQCPWYYENELARRPLYSNGRSPHSLVYVTEKRKWVCETRFCPGDIAFKSQIYTLRVLHSLQLAGASGVRRLVGVVRDNRDCIVGFLTEFPTKGCLVDILQDAGRSGQPVSYERRLKWCIQLVNIVAEVHRHTFVVGNLGLRFAGVFAVDVDDNLVLSALLRPMLINHHPTPGSIPPEHRKSRKAVRTTPQTDLFQLGRVLWRIAGNKLYERSEDLCCSCDCPNSSSSRCTEPHDDPIALRMASGEYSEEMQRVINICRSESPAERGTAIELSRILMGTTHSRENTRANTPERALQVCEYQRQYNNTIGCEHCGQRCTAHYFECEICCKGDFDVCLKCFDQGLHCLEAQHLLLEYRMRVHTRKCFSRVHESGAREVSYS